MQPFWYILYLSSIKTKTIIKHIDFNKTIAPWLGKTCKLINAYIADVFNEHQIAISKQQWVILKILNENPEGVIQNELAFITDRNKASLTRLINGMEKKKLVIRIQSKKDSRKNIIKSTATGSDLFLKTKPLMLNSILKIQEGVTEDEMNTLIQIMSKIQLNLKQQSI
jgi:DNA-binding MarR family transcriptional regulator